LVQDHQEYYDWGVRTRGLQGHHTQRNQVLSWPQRRHRGGKDDCPQEKGQECQKRGHTLKMHST